MRRRVAPILLMAALCGGMSSRAAAAELAVIVSAQAPQEHLSDSQLRNIYLKKVYLDSAGHALVPVNLPPGNPLRQAFLHATLRMTETQLQDYWNRQYFQGVSPPYVLASQTAVAQFVAETPGAIGYVLACHVSAEVSVVAQLSLPLPAIGTEDCPTGK